MKTTTYDKRPAKLAVEIKTEVWLIDCWEPVREFIVSGGWLKWETEHLSGFASPRYWRYV